MKYLNKKILLFNLYDKIELLQLQPKWNENN